MNTDTPETDAERRRLKKSKSYPTDPVPADFARKLERERNAAREALSGRTVSCSQCNELANKLAANEAYQMGLIAERDEAREALENYKALSIHTCSQYCQRPLCVANRQIAEMREVIKEIYAEADACADGAPDASSHDKLCLEIATKLQPYLKP